MLGGSNHLYLFIDGQKQFKAGARKFVEVLVKDGDNNILSTTRENVALANKDLQDYSALLLALKKAKGLGASKITLFVNNADLCDYLNADSICCDDMLKGFHQEATKLIKLFDSVIVKMAEEEVPEESLREFHA